MKRGVFINLRILLILLFLVALPFVIMFGAAQAATSLGCEMSGASIDGTDTSGPIFLVAGRHTYSL